MTIDELNNLINKPDISLVVHILRNISLMSFTEYFSELTNNKKYHRDVQNKLIKMYKEIHGRDPDEKIDVALGVMIGEAETLIQNSDDIPDDACYIIEKLIAEPIAIVNEHFNTNNQTTKGNYTL